MGSAEKCPKCGSAEYVQQLPDRPVYATSGHDREIVDIRGYAYEHVVRRAYDRPVRVHVFYPTGVRTTRSGYLFPRKVISNSIDYAVAHDEYGLPWCLLQGSKTRSDPRWGYEEDIPCPQPRAKKTWYEGGRWYKSTRSKGREAIW